MKLTPQHHVLYLLYRPSEPIFIPKGQRGIVFDVVNNDFLAPRFRHAREELVDRISNHDAAVLVPLKEIPFPDLSEAMEVGRDEQFSIFLPSHGRAAESLLNIFMSATTYDDFLSCAVYARDRVNPMMFVYIYSVAVIHRPDMKDIYLPPLNNIFPDKFLDGSHLARAREHADVLTALECRDKRNDPFPHGPRWIDESGRRRGELRPLRGPLARERHAELLLQVFPKDYTASDLDVEHRLAYFREDVGINQHHWHWHIVYPFVGTMEVVNKDRRGELFYYMHQQVLGRYNFERLCNRLGRVVRLLDLRKKIPEGYFPKLYCSIAGKTWPSRRANAKLSNVNNEDLNFVFDIDDLERWKTRIIEAIHLKRVVDKQGRHVPLTEKDGIDILGNMVEASELLSKNYDIYGNLHNLGHMLISLCHDPDGKYKELAGVMGDQATAMRDPVFYRWHAFIDYIFQLHKSTLKPYALEELEYKGLSIEEISVSTRDESSENVLKTFWQEKDIELQAGLDFASHMPIHGRIIRLQHAPFSYKIKVRNNTGNDCKGTVRIFLAPKYDEKGKEMLFIDQKRLFIELDKFSYKFGKQTRLNVIERKSEDSYVTVKDGPSIGDMEMIINHGIGSELTPWEDFCGCGWPDNMLIPKGTPEGFECQLFVMVSDAEKDLVNPTKGPFCSDASSYCGARDAKYPDSRAMGYPFDRPPADKVKTLKDFVGLAPNMAVQDVKIVFEDRTEPARSEELVPPSIRYPMTQPPPC